MPLLLVVILVFVAIAGVWLAVNVFAKPLDWFFGMIWQPKLLVGRADMAKRIKELCVDGTVSEETAVMMAAKENGITERELLQSLEAVSPAQLKAMLSGNYKSAFGFTSWEDMFGGGKGKGGRR